MEKNIIIAITFFLMGLSFAVGATILYNAKDIEYTPSDKSWNVNNMQDAINDIIDNYIPKSEILGKVWEFDYTGGEQTFSVPIKGTYKIELWGAQGGTTKVYVAQGGKGAYVSGNVDLKKEDEIFIYVGGEGSSTSSGVSEYIKGGYNGGGSTGGQACCQRSYGTGGGATDIRIVKGEWNNIDSLKSRIMVAAGGGGAFGGDNGGAIYTNGGYGGALTGGDGTQNSNNQYCYGMGASQTSGGRITTNCTFSSSFGGVVTGGFGYGGIGNISATGGGSGYYGGSSSGHIASAGGGSSYIKGYTGCDTTYISYQGFYDITNAKMIAGNAIMPTHDGASTMTGNAGNGFARITLVSLD